MVGLEKKIKELESNRKDLTGCIKLIDNNQWTYIEENLLNSESKY